MIFATTCSGMGAGVKGARLQLGRASPLGPKQGQALAKAPVPVSAG